MCKKDLQKPLTSDEIELRIGSTKQGSGFSVLLYKTARTDRNRLDQAFGIFGWKNQYRTDQNGNLVAEISVYDKEKQQWVTKEDVGVESRSEKEKGQYSDAFKRAGFKWGIGVELYKAPFIWVKWNDWNGKYPKARVQNWSVKLVDSEEGILGGFSIHDRYGNQIWNSGGSNTKPKDKNTESDKDKNTKPNDNKKPPNDKGNNKNPFTKKQNGLIKKLIKSHVFDSDREEWRDKYKLVETKEEASAYIDDLKNELHDRKAAEKQEKEEANS